VGMWLEHHVGMWLEHRSARFTLRWGSRGDIRIDAALRLQGSDLHADIKALVFALRDPEAGATALNILKALNQQALPFLRKCLTKERNKVARKAIQEVIGSIEQSHADFNTVDLSGGTDEAKYDVIRCPTCGKSQEGHVPENGAFFCGCGAILCIENYRLKNAENAEQEN